MAFGIVGNENVSSFPTLQSTLNGKDTKEPYQIEKLKIKATLPTETRNLHGFVYKKIIRRTMALAIFPTRSFMDSLFLVSRVFILFNLRLFELESSCLYFYDDDVHNG